MIPPDVPLTADEIVVIRAALAPIQRRMAARFAQIEEELQAELAQEFTANLVWQANCRAERDVLGACLEHIDVAVSALAGHNPPVVCSEEARCASDNDDEAPPEPNDPFPLKPVPKPTHKAAAPISTGLDWNGLVCRGDLFSLRTPRGEYCVVQRRMPNGLYAVYNRQDGVVVAATGEDIIAQQLRDRPRPDECLGEHT